MVVCPTGLAFLCPRGYIPIQTPFFMGKSAMAAVAQVRQKRTTCEKRPAYMKRDLQKRPVYI